MDIPLYVVDAFTDKPFHGNPAAVCPLSAWLDDDLMQAIAAENNLSETAFLVAADAGYELRWFTLDFPVRELEDIEDARSVISQIEQACGLRPESVVKAAANCMAIYSSEQSVRLMTPGFTRVAALDFRGLVVTAPGDDHDFVSRFFAPRVGINEDPVTGSVHCGLIPYWHRRTGKTEMRAFQASSRGGELICGYRGERVEIRGQAILFSEGKIYI